MLSNKKAGHFCFWRPQGWLAVVSFPRLQRCPWEGRPCPGAAGAIGDTREHSPPYSRAPQRTLDLRRMKVWTRMSCSRGHCNMPHSLIGWAGQGRWIGKSQFSPCHAQWTWAMADLQQSVTWSKLRCVGEGGLTQAPWAERVQRHCQGWYTAWCI